MENRKELILFNVEQSKYKHSDLIPIAYEWCIRRGCGVAFKELKTASNEQPDVIGFRDNISILIEVKVSRSDFLCDAKKSFRKVPSKGMGTYRFYMCPAGLINRKDLPNGWGLIWIGNTGKAQTIYNPYPAWNLKGVVSSELQHNQFEGFFDKNHSNELALMYSALRRLHIKGHIDSIYDKEYNYSHKEKF